VALTGGDPLLRSDLVAILNYAGKLGMGTGFSTSLLNLTEQTAREEAATGAQIQVSIDGSSAETNDYNRGRGSFEKALKGMELLAKHGIEFRIAFCIMKHNAADVRSMIGLAERVGAKEVAFRKMIGRLDRRRASRAPPGKNPQAVLIGAAGLAAAGAIPFPTTFAVFATKRACDQVSVSIAYPKLNVKIPGCYPGLPTSKAR
jgi:MoaA/NifB/PqqE/SkfB family radical SAM enzyme